MKKVLFAVWEVAEVFLVALIAVAAIKYFLIQPFIVNGASMEPTFYNGDYLLVDEVSYHFEQASRGDVIVFKSPQDPSIYFIKRVIGLPGETVEVDNSVVRINGKVLGEEYVPQGILGDWTGHVTFKLTDQQYFVLGDNRLNSFDSRYWGPLNKSAIIGLVRLRLWPPKSVKLFDGVQYFSATSTALN
jgi:signal peptidase I